MIVDGDKLKAHLGGVQAKLNFDTVEGFVKVTERDFRRIVGKEMYQFLDDYSGAHPDEIELVKAAEGCVAWAAYDLAVPHLKLRVGDMGIMKNSPANTVAVTKWEYVDLREANLAMVDIYWEFFWELLTDIGPQAWRELSAYRKHNQQFIRSADELYKYLPLAGRNRRFFDQVSEYIRRAEQLYIGDLLTEQVYDELKDRWQDDDVILTPMEVKLIEKIRQALAPLAIYEAYPYLPIKVDENGLREVRRWDGTTNETLAAMPLRQAQREQLWKDGQLYLARLRRFLDLNSSETLFASYYALNIDDNPYEDEDFTDSPHIII